MKYAEITDKEVKKILKYIDMAELTESINTLPENERELRSDLEILIDEIEYFIWNYESDGNIFGDDLEESKYILKVTKRGKYIPISMVTFTPIYSRTQIENAKNTVSEYKRLKKGFDKAHELRRVRL